MTRVRRPYDYVKRFLDVCVAATALVALSPLLGVLALLVAVNLGRPVMFRQLRVGRDSQVFTLVKFRTMKNEDPAQGLVEDADRLTDMGRRLRSLSADELPTLWNVVKGDMSMVGPRPLLVEYLPKYSAHQARRHEVRPGVTGLAQVNGRNQVTWDQRLTFDVMYVDTYGPMVDFRVLVNTLGVVLGRRGVSQAGHVTMPRFSGADND